MPFKDTWALHRPAGRFLLRRPPGGLRMTWQNVLKSRTDRVLPTWPTLESVLLLVAGADTTMSYPLVKATACPNSSPPTLTASHNFLAQAQDTPVRCATTLNRLPFCTAFSPCTRPNLVDTSRLALIPNALTFQTQMAPVSILLPASL